VRLDLPEGLLDVLADAVAARLAERDRGSPISPAAYTPATLAAELGRSPRAIRAAIHRGELAATKRGQGWVISAEAVAAWAAPRAPARRVPRRRQASGGGPMARALRSR
jgi:excisionase family DNA binding protein